MPRASLTFTRHRANSLRSAGMNTDLVRARAHRLVIGRDAVAFLEAACQRPARQWLARGLPQIARWRKRLAGSLEQLDVPVRESPATFLLARVGDAKRITAHMRSHDVRVRNGDTFGLRQWIRLSAQPVPAQKVLMVALEAAL